MVADPALYEAGDLPTVFTNARLIGRSVWNSQWKIVIPAHTLLKDEQQGIEDVCMLPDSSLSGGQTRELKDKASHSILIMRVFLILMGLAILGWLVWLGLGWSRLPVAVAPVPIAWQNGPPTLTVTDGTEIFKKAFWRQPTLEDEILHAERHEWSDAGGLLRWQWFLVVKASPGLIKYLRDDNAFGLAPAATMAAVAEAPSWFNYEADDVTTLMGPGSGLRLMFSKSGNRLYATAAGQGFTRGAPESAPPVQGAPEPGRLPATSPPVSKQ